MSEPAIVINHLVKHFGRTKAVDDISLTVPAGEVFGFLGPNGAGKTTTIRLLMDYLRPDAGTASVFGLDSVRQGVAARARIGFTPAVTTLNERWSGHDHIDYARHLRHVPDRAVDLVKRLDFDPTKKTKQLSAGNRQKLSLILAFMFPTDLIILDEPTNGLDPLLQQTVYELVQEAHQRGATVFMSSHNLAEVERTCTRVAILRAGKLIAEETMATLQDKHLYNIQLWFDHDVDRSAVRIPQAQIVEAFPRLVTIKYNGDIQPVLDALAQLKPHDVAINHASLEEHFMTFYNHHGATK